MNKLINVNNRELTIKEFDGKRVVTFKDIDVLHERVEGTAGRNFRENKSRLVENEDYFSLKGDELRVFKQATNFVGSNAKEIILITESGYLMLVKSFQDELAWKVQRELVNNYFRVKRIKELSPMEQLRLYYQALEHQGTEIESIREEVQDIKDNLPLLGVDCDEITNNVHKVATNVLGGYKTAAYSDRSLSRKVYSDIYTQLKREFQIKSYKAIKRSQLNKAIEIISAYKPPMALVQEVDIKNNQIIME